MFSLSTLGFHILLANLRKLRDFSYSFFNNKSLKLHASIITNKS